MEELKDRILAMVKPVLEREGVDLVELELKGRSGDQVLRIFVDEVGGINLDRCVQLSREIGEILDIEDPIPGRYRLEVSSPGVRRPLKNLRDFERNVGREVSVEHEEGGEVFRVEGRIESVTKDSVILDSGGAQIEVSIDSIRLAKIKVKL